MLLAQEALPPATPSLTSASDLTVHQTYRERGVKVTNIRVCSDSLSWEGVQRGKWKDF